MSKPVITSPNCPVKKALGEGKGVLGRSENGREVWGWSNNGVAVKAESNYNTALIITPGTNRYP